jgi:hypothetical protein
VVIGFTGDGTLIITPLKDVASVRVEGREPVKAEPTSITFLGWTGIVLAVALTVSLFWFMSRWQPPTSFDPD